MSGRCARAAGRQVRACASSPFVVTERWGYAPVGARGRPELYDLAADALAEKDVAAAHEAECREMHGLLVKHLRDCGADEATIKLGRGPVLSASTGTWARDY